MNLDTPAIVVHGLISPKKGGRALSISSQLSILVTNIQVRTTFLTFARTATIAFRVFSVADLV